MDFSKLKWDVAKPNELFKKHPELKIAILKHIRDSECGFSTITLARYIILTYAKKSPFVEREDNILKRKKDVCRFLNINLEEEQAKKLVNGKYIEVCKAIIGFLQLEESDDWLTLIANQEIASSIQANLLSGTEEDEKKRVETLFKLNKEILPEITRLKTIVFAKDQEVSNKLGTFLQEEEARRVYPEDFKDD